MATQVDLKVNDTPIPLDFFVAEFVESTIRGMVASLKGAEEVGSLSLSIMGDTVDLTINGSDMPANPFVTMIIRNTVFGMVSTLKGVGEITRVDITIKR